MHHGSMDVVQIEFTCVLVDVAVAQATAVVVDEPHVAFEFFRAHLEEDEDDILGDILHVGPFCAGAHCGIRIGLSRTSARHMRVIRAVAERVAGVVQPVTPASKRPRLQ